MFCFLVTTDDDIKLQEDENEFNRPEPTLQLLEEILGHGKQSGSSWGWYN